MAGRTDRKPQGEDSTRPRVLVVDDDEHLLDILSRWLEAESFTAITARGGPACLAELEKSEVDVIVLDVMMPDMDGFQVCERLRASAAWRSIPVILVTAKDDMETRARGMALGVSEYLTKPVQKGELIARLHAQVGVRDLGRRLTATAAALRKTS